MVNEWDNLLQLIRDQFTQIQITRNDLLHPSSSLVVKFYTNFILVFEENIQFLAGPYYTPTEFNDHLEIEDRIFQTMYFIISTEYMNFMLSDIYNPVPIRTKSFFKICCHLLNFADSILEEAENLGSNILKMKENISRFEQEHENILSEINEKARKKSELIENKEKQLEQLSRVRQFHEDMKDCRAQKDNVYVMKNKEIEILKQQLEQEEHESKRLDIIEKELSEQFTSEAEYKKMLNIVENLKYEFKSLGSDQNNMDDVLSHENDELLHYQDCRKRIPDIGDLNIEIVKILIEVEEELKDLQVENEKLISNKRNTLKVIKEDMHMKLLEMKHHVEKLSSSFQDIMEKKKKVEEEGYVKINKMKEEKKTNCNYNNGLIKTSLQEIKQLETNMTNLKDIFCKEYVKIATADSSAKEKFKHGLFKINII